MDRHLQRLLWRLGCGLVSTDRVVEAFEEKCRCLVDKRFEEQLRSLDPATVTAPYLEWLGEFDSSVALARAHTAGKAFRSAFQAVTKAESALERTFSMVEALQPYAEVHDSWSRLVTQLDLEPLRNLATLHNVDRTLHKVEKYLAEGEPEKARLATTLAQRWLSALQQREEKPGQQTVHLKQRLTRWLSVRDDPVLTRLQRVLELGYLDLSQRLLEDWEMRPDHEVAFLSGSPTARKNETPLTEPRLAETLGQAEELCNRLATIVRDNSPNLEQENEGGPR